MYTHICANWESPVKLLNKFLWEILEVWILVKGISEATKKVIYSLSSKLSGKGIISGKSQEYR